MDTWYAEYGKEYELAAEELRELGVYYHPDSRNSSDTSNTSSSTSPSTSNSIDEIVKTITTTDFKCPIVKGTKEMFSSEELELNSYCYIIKKGKSLIAALGETKGIACTDAGSPEVTNNHSEATIKYTGIWNDTLAGYMTFHIDKSNVVRVELDVVYAQYTFYIDFSKVTRL